MFCGIDLGSTTIKAVLLDADKNLVDAVIVPTGNAPRATAQTLWENFGKPPAVVATGYGRKLVDFAAHSLTEISAHARGVHRLHPAARTLIEVGGQDSKVMRLDENGKVIAFAMNDKCAAGTGCFLTNLATRFNLSLAEFTQLRRDLPEKITATCAVFAESEIVGLLARGVDFDKIVAGVHFAVAERLQRLYLQVNPARNESADAGAPIYFSGGGAHNAMLRHALAALLSREIHVADHAQLLGALGAADDNTELKI